VFGQAHADFLSCAIRAAIISAASGAGVSVVLMRSSGCSGASYGLSIPVKFLITPERTKNQSKKILFLPVDTLHDFFFNGSGCYSILIANNILSFRARLFGRFCLCIKCVVNFLVLITLLRGDVLPRKFYFVERLDEFFCRVHFFQY
jgi:hypothetical protein